MSRQTTEPAATTQLLPILQPGNTITPAPIHTFEPIQMSLCIGGYTLHNKLYGALGFAFVVNNVL